MRKGRAQKWRKMEREKTINIRRAEKGDEKSLAYIQTESWKEAFKGIVPAEVYGTGRNPALHCLVGCCQGKGYDWVCGKRKEAARSGCGRGNVS